jgi:hypothetical protein
MQTGHIGSAQSPYPRVELHVHLEGSADAHTKLRPVIT